MQVSQDLAASQRAWMQAHGRSRRLSSARGELRSSFLQGWIFQLVSLIRYASAWNHAAATLMLHDMCCRSDMNLRLASSRNMTASETCCWQALAKHAGRMFLVQVHWLSGQALLRSNFLETLVACGFSLKRGFPCKALPRKIRCRAGFLRKIISRAGLFLEKCGFVRVVR